VGHSLLAPVSFRCTIDFPSTLTETYADDANNNLSSKTDRKGNSITYSYDRMNRLTAKAYPDSTSVAYTYDNGPAA
jgi:YD repeat-containing protein